MRYISDGKDVIGRGRGVGYGGGTMAVPRNIYAIAEYFLFILPMLGLHNKYITLVNEEGGLNFQSIWLNTADIIKVVLRIIF